ncbi:MAG: hypothetical protein H7836_04440 [Magnetococcus sp. YQC-3]
MTKKNNPVELDRRPIAIKSDKDSSGKLLNLSFPDIKKFLLKFKIYELKPSTYKDKGKIVDSIYIEGENNKEAVMALMPIQAGEDVYSVLGILKHGLKVSANPKFKIKKK